jgi:hypothetical protein
MKNVHSMQRQVEMALAFAHAALEETTSHRVAQARTYANEILPQIASLTPSAFSLGEARQLFEHVTQLRAVLGVLERKLEYRRPREAN